MVTSAEIRWFFKGMINNDILQFFKEHQVVFREEQPRTDWYLLNKDNSTNIKLRNNHFEIKKLIDRFDYFKISPEIKGNAENWVKFSFEVVPAEDYMNIINGKNQQWLGMDKKRSVVRYEVLNDGSVREYSGNEPVEGCTLEICFIRTLKLDFWTLGFEASGEAESVSRNLELVTSHVFSDSSNLSLLKPENSYSYPEFLGKINML